MILTKQELISSLQNEVRILLHLAGKIDPSKLDYRPTPKQRSTRIELLRYMVVMGPMLIRAIKAGAFDGPAWQAATAEANAMNFDQVLSAIQKQSSLYADALGGFSDQDFRGEIDLFGGGKSSRGSILINMVLAGYAAYRTQLFLYLKSAARRTQHDEFVGRRGRAYADCIAFSTGRIGCDRDNSYLWQVCLVLQRWRFR